jgi:hypothetical protein
VSYCSEWDDWDEDSSEERTVGADSDTFLITVKAAVVQLIAESAVQLHDLQSVLDADELQLLRTWMCSIEHAS